MEDQEEPAEAEGTCVKKQTITHKTCLDTDFCHAGEKDNVYFCLVGVYEGRPHRKVVTLVDTKAELCCAAGENCVWNATASAYGCFVDVERHQWRRCAKEPIASNVIAGFVAGGIIGILLIAVIAIEGDKKRRRVAG